MKFDVGSFVDTCDHKALKSLVIDKDGRAWPTLKRLADDLIVPRRRLKRQRIAVHGNESGMLLDNGQLDRGMSMSPRSLQFALPKLTSHDTLCVLHAMHTIPSELRHLNGRASVFRLRQHCKVRKVFGWRHLLCQEEDTGQLARRVVWKSAKALDSMRMRPLARRIWQASTDTCSGSHGLELGKAVYTVNRSARVVYSTKKPSHCRRARHQVWLECYFDDGLQICVARKELRQFSDYRVPDTCATECEGFLVRPLYTRTISSQLAGCSLHCLRAVDASASGVWAAVDLKQRLIHDLPQLTLQWEEDNIYDLMQVPQVLLDSVFA